MAGKSTISMTFKLDGDNKGFKDLTKGAEGLKAALTSTVNEAKQLSSSKINFAALATGLNAVKNSIMEINTMFQDLGNAYAVQEAAETKLATVMRQRMKATDDEIQSIKNLASAQQALGIVGDEVQLSGAQQLSTFLYEKKSLDVLIPAMNNLIAQQKGYEATTQDAVNIGNMMGKVMMGQTAALKRVGVSFSEAEGEVLAYGTEEEKAAMLAQVITNNVGNMNAELAATDSGKLKQLTNTLGDYKEILGGIVKDTLPFLTIASQASIALNGVITLTAGVRTLTRHVTIAGIRSKGLAAVTMMMGVKASRSAVLVRVFSGAVHNATLRTTALKLALRGLMIATGVGIAITAVTMAIEAFAVSAEDAAEKENELAAETKELNDSMRDISEGTANYSHKEIAALERLFNVAKDETKSRRERAAAMTDLKNKYPSYFSGMNTEKINVANLTTQYNLLRDSIIQAARARAAQDKIVENEKHRLEIEEKQRQLQIKKENAWDKLQEAREKKAQAKKALDQYDQNGTFASSTTAAFAQRDSYFKEIEKAAKEEQAALNAYNEIVNKRNKLAGDYYNYGLSNDYLKSEVAKGGNIGTAAAPVVGGAGGGSVGGGHSSVGAVWTKEAKTLKEIEDNLTILRDKLQNATKENAAAINKEIKYYEEEAAAIRKVGIEKNKEQPENTSYGPKWSADPKTLKQYEDNISILNEELQNSTTKQAYSINMLIDEYQKEADAIRNAGKASAETSASMTDNLINTWGAAKQVGSSIEGITSAIEGTGNAWQKVTGIIDGFISIYQSIASVVGIINAITGASIGHTAAKGAEAVAEEGAAAVTTGAATENATSAGIQVAANKAATASFKELAAAQYFAAHAYIPFIGFGIGAGFVASMEAAVTAAGLPMLAKGGIATGPTLAMVGEYGGASRNPEVIAPLDKLRKLIGTNNGGESGGSVEFRIKGRDLLGILEKENNIRRRS